MIAYNDGGGKAAAAIRPIYGLDKVVRFMLGITSKAPPHLQAGYLGVVNGQPGVVFI